MKVLFDANQQAIPPADIKQQVSLFNPAYTAATDYVIKRSQSVLDRTVFRKNVAYLMSRFKMTRVGVFNGVKNVNGNVQDPRGILDDCWAAIGHDILQLRSFIDSQKLNRARTLVEMSKIARQQVISDLMSAFKKLLYPCMGWSVRGTVGASKVLFAVLPEVALPVDTKEWKKPFNTPKDYSKIITLMADEIIEWETRTRHKLEKCDPSPNTTLPAIYSVMAMAAR